MRFLLFSTKQFLKLTLLMAFFIAYEVASSQNIGINSTGTTADASAMLDISSSNKGLLIPRVALTGTSDVSTIASPLTSLLVYNTATAGGVTPGFYYWNGSSWIKLATGNSNNDWTSTGNSGTVDGTNFIGTTDNVPLNLRVNNVSAGKINSSGRTFFGYEAGKVVTSTGATAFGYRALFSNTSGFNNTAIGYQALYSNTGDFNTAIGHDALYENVGGGGNTAIGSSALKSNTTGSYNIAIGIGSLQSNVTGQDNIACGRNSLYANTGGSFNSTFGGLSLNANTTGTANCAFGYNSLSANTIGEYNTAIGTSSLNNLISGSYNVALGRTAGSATTISNHNVFLGYFAGGSGNIGNDNVIIGSQAGQNATGAGNVFIGRSAGQSETGSNKLYIDNSNTSAPLIYGDFSTGQITINDIVKLAPRTSAPTSPTKGTMYFDNTTNKLRVYDGTTWQNCW